MKKEHVVVSFVLGVMVGALATLLLTPYTGDEVREKLKEESDRLLDKLVESVGNLERIREKLEAEAFDMEEEI